MTRRVPFTILLLSSVAPWPGFAQETADGITGAAASRPIDGSPDEEDEAIVVVGQRARGSVVGDIPPENTLDPRDIRATGATTIAELLDAVSAQTGSARGRSGGRPILLLNGQRISGFRELRDLPPEAIQRMEILPEEVALKYGYAADQRVVNIVLRRRFNSTSAEVRGEAATDGDYGSGSLDATRLIIRDNKRTSINLNLSGNTALYEGDRDIDLDPAALVDERDARTLVGARQAVRLTGTHNRPVAERDGLTLTAEAGVSKGQSRFGRADFDPGNVLGRDSTTSTLGLGSVINAQRGDWRLSATGNADYERSTAKADRSVATVLTDDESRSTRTSFGFDTTANGPLFQLPAGKASATLKLGLSRVDLDSEARRRDLVNESDLGRTQADGSVNFDLPVTGRDSGIGRVSLNANAGVSRLSDFGTLASYGAGAHWSPTSRLNLLGSFTREEGAPTLQQLGDPLVETAGEPFFDAIKGETVEVSTLTGGNRELDADRRTVFKIGANWRAMETPDFRLRAEFVSQRIDNPQISFPAATPALEAAFPGRFQRDGGGRLVQVDLRPVNADQSRRETIRWGFDLTKSLRSKRPSQQQIQALRRQFATRFGRQAGQRGSGADGPPRADTPPPADGAVSQADGPPRGGFEPGGGGRVGGLFGGRNGGRLTLSLTHTVTLKDELDVAPAIPTLDYLDGEASSALGGRPRHSVELQGGYYNSGLGARINANWRSATRVDSAIGEDIRFEDYATLDLRLFANLGERFGLVARNPFFLGSSVQVEIKNILDEKPVVRGANGLAPFAYQGDRLEPIGRTVSLSFRKLFLPRRFQRPAGGGRR